jgi:UDP-glucuronate decarboxylase
MMGNGRIFGAWQGAGIGIPGGAGPLGVAGGRSGLAVYVLGLALLLVASWWGWTRGAGDSAATIAGLERKLADLETRHARTHLDMAQQVQRIVSEQTAQLFSGPLVQRSYPATLALPSHIRRRILVTGGAGFVGSHLVDALMLQGHQVYVLDNLFTGRTTNIQHWLNHPNFQFFQADVVQPFYIEVDQIYHLACPASPPHYQYNPIKTIKTSTQGTLNMLGLAKRVKARLLFTSTSEVYGDPEVHPQTEEYRGNVNTMGPRSCYDEGKRVGETLCYAYHTEEGVEVRIARIFNTFGPRMHPNDGRVVSNFIIQALQGKPLSIYGDGSQTRSFQYVSDLVTGLIKLMNAEDLDKPVNIGNPDEYTVQDFAEKIRAFVGSDSEIQHLPATLDDPRQRKPDITRAKSVLGWEPRLSVDEGLYYTVEYFRQELGLAPHAAGAAGAGAGGAGAPAAAAAAAAAAASKGGKGAGAVATYTRRDPAPLWVATLVNDALTDKEKGLTEDGL